MKISYNWLKNLISIGLPVSETAAVLTGSGLEIEGTETFETVPGGLKGLVIGEVVECGKHPDADRLSLTRVDVGGKEPLSIVCGAPNVKQGQKVVVAPVGTKLFPVTGEPFEIKKSKIRGAVSEGMICAEDEIGIGSSHAGIIVLPDNVNVGTPVSDHFKIESDTVFEIGLTPNRSDAASHLGVARDLAAVLNTREHNNDLSVSLPGQNELPSSDNKKKVEIEVENKSGCKRYSGLVVTGVKVKDSPEWIRNRLRSIGVRPINNIVDVTNFVLHELGQPLHAFDADKIAGDKIVVRNAKKGEKFKTLDEVDRDLSENDLMICDERSPLCIAGVFGGASSGISGSTTSVFLESAYFDPDQVRASSRRHGLKTDASFRFERGTDPNMTIAALLRAASLILEIAGGEIGMDIADVYPEKLEPYKVAFSFANCSDLIGKDIERATVKRIILNLGIEIDSEGNDGLLLKVPRYKTDVTREVDVIEEVMRVYGYNNVEMGKHISYTAYNSPPNFELRLENKVTETLSGAGLNEIMCLSLTRSSYYHDENKLVKVMNPLSQDLNVMRKDLLFGGLETIAYNINRKATDLKLFEIGKTYQVDAEAKFPYKEEKKIAIWMTGELYPQNPYGLKGEAGLSYLKSVVTHLLQRCGVEKFQSQETENINFEYGLSYTVNGKKMLDLGLVKKTILRKMDIQQPVFFADISWDVLLRIFSKQKVEFTEISRFPSVRRDLALLIDRSVQYRQIEEIAFSTEKKFLQEVNLFDVYEGEKLGNKKSYAVSFTLLNKEATLTDKQIEAVMDKLVSNYKEKLGAELR
jgi:phenylalanyl-tRNA synthetase beta chain